MTRVDAYLSSHGLSATVEMLYACPWDLEITDAHAANLEGLILWLFSQPAETVATLARTSGAKITLPPSDKPYIEPGRSGPEGTRSP